MKRLGAGNLLICVAVSAMLAGGPLLATGVGGVETAPKPVTIVASPLGQGAACSHKNPCSLQQAQKRARQLSPNMSSDIDVSLDGGTYDLTQPLAFGTEDSGTNGFTVNYLAAPDAHPIFSGGVNVTGWHLVDASKNIWAAPIAPGFDTRQLYVNGVRVTRSSGLPSAYYLQTTNGFISSSPVLANWRDITNVAAVFTGGNGAWTQPSCNIASVSGDVITMSEPCWRNLHLFGDGSQEVSWVYGPQGGFGGLSDAAQPTFFQNAYELLSPGHWNLDTTLHEMFYVPTAGQDMANATFLAPVLQTLVNIQGTLSNPVHNLSFSGIQLSYATWTQPDTDQGFAEMQADWTLTGPGASNSQGTCQYSTPHGLCPYASWTRTPGAVVLSATHDVAIENDVFTHLGGAGLDIEYGSQYDTVLGNDFTDISASAIQLGSTNDPLPADVDAGNSEINAYDTITDNYIHSVAIEYLGGVGIWVGYAQHALISHNQIDNVPYTAISIGWAGWHSNFLSPNSDPNVNSFNVISDNLLYNYMQTLGDGGAIYTNGGQASGWTDELVISGNVAYGGTNTDFSLYTDTGSKYIRLTNNLVYDQPVDSFASGGCHTVGHIRLLGNYFSQLGPLYPCDAAVDVEALDDTLVCTNLPAGQAPMSILANAGIEPSLRTIVDNDSPTVSMVGPAQLPLSGGSVLISGSGFQSGSTVDFGTQAATSVTVISDNYLLALAPAGTGTVPVTVFTSSGLSEPTSASQLTYSASPTPCLPVVGGNISSSLLP